MAGPGAGPGEQARHSLRQCLVALRKFLGTDFDSVLFVSDTWLALDRSYVPIDALRLMEIEGGAPSQADELLGLCRGPFLRSLVTRAQPFDDWATSQRGRFQGSMQLALGQALTVAIEAKRTGDVARIRARMAELGLSRREASGAGTLPMVLAGPVPERPRLHRRRPLWQLFRAAASFSAGALVAAGMLWGTYYVSDDFRDWADRAVLGGLVTPRIAVRPFTSLNGTTEEMSLAGG